MCISVFNSQVVRVSVRETTEALADGKPHLDVALLELDPGQPVMATPVCLDHSGNVLQQLATGQLGLVRGRNSAATLCRIFPSFYHFLKNAYYITTE